MKVKFTKNVLGYKADAEVELDDAEAKELIDSGKATEVKVDPIATAVKGLEDRINEKMSEAVETATALVTEKISKSFSDRKTNIKVGNPNSLNDENRGFKHLSEFSHAVKAQVLGGNRDERLLGLEVKAGSPTESGTNADGGYTMPPGFTPNFFDPVPGSVDLWQFVDALPINTRTMNIPTVKHYDFSNSTATNGVVVSVKTEGSGGSASKVIWENLSYTLKTHFALIPTTEELEEDTGIALGSFLNKEASRWIYELRNKAIVTTVSGSFTPILGHACTKVVTRNTAGAFKFEDVGKMLANFYGDLNSAIWIMSPSNIAQVVTMTSGQQNIFTPGGIQNAAPWGSLYGRPIVPNVYLPALGSSSNGDVVLADMSKYKAVYRGGIDAAVSMHLYFDAYQNAYRFAFRADAQPGLSTTVTYGDGTTTASPFVVLKATTT